MLDPELAVNVDQCTCLEIGHLVIAFDDFLEDMEESTECPRDNRTNYSRTGSSCLTDRKVSVIRPDDSCPAYLNHFHRVLVMENGSNDHDHAHQHRGVVIDDPRGRDGYPRDTLKEGRVALGAGRGVAAIPEVGRQLTNLDPNLRLMAGHEFRWQTLKNREKNWLFPGLFKKDFI